MPVKIDLFKNYQLRTKSNEPNVLELPAIELSPDRSRNNIPHISSVNISVTGNPPELANMIQLAYKRVQAIDPFKLETPQRVKQNDCRLEEPSLPLDVNCVLEVKVEYFDSDSEGNPNLGALREAMASCHMWWNSVEIKPPKPEEPKPEEPKPEEPKPEEPKPEEPKPPENTLQDEPRDKYGTQEEKQSPPPSLGPEKKYPGWFAIDFGTSNSTVTLYEKKLVVPPDRLPKEQEKKLRSGLSRWLNDRPKSEIPGVSGNDWNHEWQTLISEVSKEFPDLDGQGKLGEQIFVNSNSARLLSGIRMVEIAIANRREWFRKAVSWQLHQIYHEVFREPPLEWQSLIPVELDGLRKESEIPSELEITGLEPLNVLMGHLAKQDRLGSLAQRENIEGRFHHSPKRYLGQDRSITVSQNGTSQYITVEQLIQTAFGHLIGLTGDYCDRNKDKCSQGHFNTAVVTYPTISPPRVRQQVKELVSNLGIEHVQMTYDEAVSIAIFFLWREFGGDLNVGLESFKTRCRRYGDKCGQNVLVLDIGGGTTDLALIRLTLEEVDPFEANEDRGDGGRYYKLTPKLLGSSGHLQLGGELITLRIFRLLKAAIADSLLTAIATGELERDKLPDKLRGTLDSINDRFLENGQFQTGKLLACVDNENSEGDIAAYNDALDDAEKVLPTRWKNDAARQQTFYTLWEHAEDAKLKLGKKDPTKEATEPIFILSGQQIADMLAQNDMQLPSDRLSSLSVTITVAQFERAVTPAIKEAIGIAKGLMESSLTREEKPWGQEVKDDLRQQEKLDWLILSGKTCNLYLVEQELYQQFSKSDRFLWNPEKITFVPEYTKLATSAGACYAEFLRQYIFAPQKSKEMLRKGANQLYIDVKNLLYFLPCSFAIKTQNGFQPIFEAGQKLYQLNPKESVAKVRSNKWEGGQLSITVYRKDFEDKQEQLWGDFNGETLATELGITEDDEFRNKIQVQFEIDQELNISLLFCQGKPHYLIPRNLPSLDVAEAIKKPAVISEGKVVCDIAVNVAESAAAMRTDSHEIVFNATDDYSEELKVFRYEGDGTQKKGSGLISKPLPPFPLSGKHTFYFQFRDPDSNKWERIGELPEEEEKTKYPCEYRVTLDEKGILRLHASEIPYWTDSSKECLKEEGCVFQTDLELEPNDIEEKRDPFSGIH